ncbi:hypothetical protein BCR44DRAFT_1221973 [Catenaria anguillulae PL171]|uniref:Uncharacterized protein n=1 Tax=Catenaria anguillulae PL171 TaxID=765915 RepID=A0A1Y2I3Z2_9FUNG|nr:hypothetical protein BCR44DRAFT_1221973 [Catenaria anguillulae PL171]
MAIPNLGVKFGSLHMDDEPVAAQEPAAPRAKSKSPARAPAAPVAQAPAAPQAAPIQHQAAAAYNQYYGGMQAATTAVSAAAAQPAVSQPGAAQNMGIDLAAATAAAANPYYPSAAAAGAGYGYGMMGMGMGMGADPYSMYGAGMAADRGLMGAYFDPKTGAPAALAVSTEVLRVRKGRKPVLKVSKRPRPAPPLVNKQVNKVRWRTSWYRWPSTDPATAAAACGCRRCRRRGLHAARIQPLWFLPALRVHATVHAPAVPPPSGRRCRRAPPQPRGCRHVRPAADALHETQPDDVQCSAHGRCRGAHCRVGRRRCWIEPRIRYVCWRHRWPASRCGQARPATGAGSTGAGATGAGATGGYYDDHHHGGYMGHHTGAGHQQHHHQQQHQQQQHVPQASHQYGGYGGYQQQPHHQQQQHHHQSWQGQGAQAQGQGQQQGNQGQQQGGQNKGTMARAVTKGTAANIPVGRTAATEGERHVRERARRVLGSVLVP